MSEKFSTPLRSNTFVRSNSKTTSKRNGVKKTAEKMMDDKKTEGKNDFGTNSLNLTLVGSPAPRSQVRALVSSSNVAQKCRVKPSYGSKAREQNPHEICMEKLYQFADNPTKFVSLESHEEPQMQLDLEFSDRSEESENFYNSHNIAFNENGEYRIPEYDHIRLLQFSISENHDTEANDHRHDSGSMKFDQSSSKVAASGNNDIPTNNQPFYDRFANQNLISTIHDVVETPRSQRADGSLDLSEPRAQIDEINPWNSKVNHSSNVTALDTGMQSYPLGSAINYKNNINPEVEKFMFNTEPETLNETRTKSPSNNRLLDESILSRNFAQAIRLTPFEASEENSTRDSPATSRTTLSQTSSRDGTWHGHSLNSPYFASTESNSWTDAKRRSKKDLSEEVIPVYEETEEYLTIVKNEQDSTPRSRDGGGGELGGQEYIFITGSDLRSEINPETISQHCLRYDGKPDNSSARSSITESEDADQSLTKMKRCGTTEIGKVDDDEEKDISSGGSSSDYAIRNIFSQYSSSLNSSSGTSSIGETCSDVSGSLGVKTEIQDERSNEEIKAESYVASEARRSGLLDSNIVCMTLEEVTLAADYTNKLSQIFTRVLERTETECRGKNFPEVNSNGLRLSSKGLDSQDTSKLIYICLESPHSSTTHLSS